MAFDLRDRFETTDGSRPEASELDERAGSELPLVALRILAGGDVFERDDARPPADGLDRARDWVSDRVRIKKPFGAGAAANAVAADMAVQLEGNETLVERMRLAKPIVVDLIPKKKALSRYGYPDNVVPNAAASPTMNSSAICFKSESNGAPRFDADSR